jgi:RNA polymerase sigma-70 factor (ECF subfamily)
MLGNREDAEEAVQDIFLKVQRGMAEFRGKAKIRTWLYKITVNTCLTRLRRRTPEQVHPDAEESESGSQWDTILGGGESAEEMLIEKDKNGFVLRALELVSANDKEIMLLFHVDELKYEEIASILELPIGTVGARLYRARKNLRAAMGSLLMELKG